MRQVCESGGVLRNLLLAATTAGGATLMTAYDDFGRPVSYTETDGAITRTSRDAQDRVSHAEWTQTDGTTILAEVAESAL